MMPSTYLLADQPSVPAGHRGRPAFVHRGRAVTFAELDDAATRFAAAACAAGLRPGDRVLLLAPNAIETFEVLVGCARAGLVAVPVNWRLAPERAGAPWRADAGARLVVVDPSLAHLVWAVVDSGVEVLTAGERRTRPGSPTRPRAGPAVAAPTGRRRPAGLHVRAPAGGPRACC